ncbi:alpha/beta fold hydrolase [Mycolicibacterium phlei]|uniref:alpha/beta fold hydrolase n=1 Tax=Mycolicibacterium phlei TaxID=1771 RepID=UPI0037CADFEF
MLLHGFPQFNISWTDVISRLTAAGYRCLAPNQRGYSPGARPPRRRDYRAPELARDVRALIEASGAERVHLVGHDVGATVGWVAADEIPECLASLTTFSVPHPAAFLNAMATSRQMLRSWYILFYQLPHLPEWYFRRRDWRGMVDFTHRLTRQRAGCRARRPRDGRVRRAHLCTELVSRGSADRHAPRAPQDHCSHDVRGERWRHCCPQQGRQEHRPLRRRRLPLRDSRRGLPLDP